MFLHIPGKNTVFLYCLLVFWFVGIIRLGRSFGHGSLFSMVYSLHGQIMNFPTIQANCFHSPHFVSTLLIVLQQYKMLHMKLPLIRVATSCKITKKPETAQKWYYYTRFFPLLTEWREEQWHEKYGIFCGFLLFPHVRVKSQNLLGWTKQQRLEDALKAENNNFSIRIE